VAATVRGGPCADAPSSDSGVLCVAGAEARAAASSTVSVPIAERSASQDLCPEDAVPL